MGKEAVGAAHWGAAEQIRIRFDINLINFVSDFGMAAEARPLCAPLRGHGKENTGENTLHPKPIVALSPFHVE